jgi:hypothetical protein
MKISSLIFMFLTFFMHPLWCYEELYYYPSDYEISLVKQLPHETFIPITEDVILVITNNLELFSSEQQNTISRLLVDHKLKILPYAFVYELLKTLSQSIEKVSPEYYSSLENYYTVIVSGKIGVLVDELVTKAPRQGESFDEPCKPNDNTKGAVGRLELTPSGLHTMISSGVVTLDGTGNVVVLDNKLEADSRILLTVQPGVAPRGTLYVSALAPATSFIITSNARAADAGVNVYYQIYLPI